MNLQYRVCRWLNETEVTVTTQDKAERISAGVQHEKKAVPIRMWLYYFRVHWKSMNSASVKFNSQQAFPFKLLITQKLSVSIFLSDINSQLVKE